MQVIKRLFGSKVPADIQELIDTFAIEGSSNTQKQRKWNAADQLVKMGERAVQPLLGALKHSKPTVRGYAVQALGDIGDARAVSPLITLLSRDSDPAVREAAAYALGKLGDAKASKALDEALTDSDNGVRQAAQEARYQLH